MSTSSQGVGIHHINADPSDFIGNGTIGRYVLLPGSDGRAQKMAASLQNGHIKHSDRQINLYLGSLAATGDEPGVDVAIVSTGMGCPSMDIVLGELLALGARNFLRVGTAGSLQPQIKFGHFVVARGAVRDEGTTIRYAPLEVPALADAGLTHTLEKVLAKRADAHFHAGVVHCKDSLHAREFGEGPQAEENRHYMRLLSKCGVLASEMETSALFIRTALAAATAMQGGQSNPRPPRAAALLAIISDDAPFSKRDLAPVTQQLIDISMDTLRAFKKADLGSA